MTNSTIDPVADIIDRITHADAGKLKDIYEREIQIKAWTEGERKLITDVFWMKAHLLNWEANFH